MIPVVAIVGRSGSGKTVLLERLIPELKGRGFSVAVVKHTHHQFEIDEPGKDSWRLKKAGASTVVITGEKRLATIMDLDKEVSLGKIRQRFLKKVHIIFVEGFRSLPLPKIEVVKEGESSELARDKNLVALVSREPGKAAIPVFKPEQVKALADFIEERFLK